MSKFEKVFISPAACDEKLQVAVRSYMELNERSASWILTKAVELCDNAPDYSPTKPLTWHIPTTFVSTEVFSALQEYALHFHLSISEAERNVIAAFLKIRPEPQEAQPVTINEEA